MKWLWAHKTQLDVLVSIFPWKTLILQQLLLSHWSHKGQYAIVFNWDSLLSYHLIAEIYSLNQKIERSATGENKPCPILHPLCMELLEKKIDMPLLIYDTLESLDVYEESFLYFYNVLSENQYFPFEAPPKSGFWCLFFNFSFCCIVGLSFLQLAKAKDANGLLQ